MQHFIWVFTVYQRTHLGATSIQTVKGWLYTHSKTCVKQPILKRPKIDFQEQLLLNAGQKYCRMLQREHSAILSTFIELPFVIKIFVLSTFEWLFYTGFAVFHKYQTLINCLISILVFFAGDINTKDRNLIFGFSCEANGKLFKHVYVLNGRAVAQCMSA